MAEKKKKVVAGTKVKAKAKKTVKKTIKKAPAKKAVVAKKTAVKKVVVAKKTSAKKAKVVVKKAPAKKIVKKAVNKKSTMKKKIVAAKKAPLTIKVKKVDAIDNGFAEGFDDRLLRNWLNGFSKNPVSEKKMKFFKKMFNKFDEVDGKFRFVFNFPAAVFGYTYNFFRKDYFGGVITFIIWEFFRTIFYANPLSVVNLAKFTHAEQNFYLLVLCFCYVSSYLILNSSISSYMLYKKFSSDKEVMLHIADKTDALNVIKKIGGFHTAWVLLMSFSISIAVLASIILFTNTL